MNKRNTISLMIITFLLLMLFINTAYAVEEKPGSFSASTNKSSYTAGESITFSWTSSAGADKYDVHIYKGSTRVEMLTNKTGNSASCTLGAGSYTAHVVAVNNAGYTDSNKFSFTVAEAPAPQKPGSFSASTNKSSYTAGESITFSWTSSTGADKYDVHIYKGSTRVEMLTNKTGNSASCTLGAGSYTAHVVAVNNAGYTDSNKVSFTVAEAPVPQKPGSFSASTNKSSYTAGESITFSWTSSTGADKYDVHIYKGSTRVEMLTSKTGNSASCTLGAGSYTAHVVAVNNAGYTDSNNISFSVNEAPAPQKPGSFNVSTNKSSYTEGESITFSWTSSEGADKYDVHIYKGSTRVEMLTNKTGNSASCTLGVGSYTAHVVAVNNAGYIDSNKVSFTVTEAPAPQKPGNFSASINKKSYTADESITFSWTSSVGADKYDVHIYKGGERVEMLTNKTGNNASCTLGVGSYIAHVVAKNDVGYTDSNKVSFTIVELGTQKPGWFEVKTNKVQYLTNEIINISWTTSQGANKYDVHIYKGNTRAEMLTNKTGNSASCTLGVGSYTLHVVALNNAGFTDSHKVSFTVVEPGTQKPGDFIVEELKIQHFTDEKIEINWTTSQYADKYDVHIYKEGTRVDILTNIIGNHASCTLPIGTYYLHVVAKNDVGYTDSCNKKAIKVFDKETFVGIESIIIPSDFQLYVGETKHLACTVTPSNATDKSLKWTSSEPLIAYVDNQGNITAIKTGETETAIITAVSADGVESNSCVVTVNASLNKKMYVNTNSLSLMASPEGAIIGNPLTYGTEVTVIEVDDRYINVHQWAKVKHNDRIYWVAYDFLSNVKPIGSNGKFYFQSEAGVSAACYITSYAMLLSNFGHDVTPKDVYNNNGKSVYANHQGIADYYGLKKVTIAENYNCNKNSLDDLLLHIYDKLVASYNKYPQGIIVFFERDKPLSDHAMLMTGYDTKTIFFHDPAAGANLPFNNTSIYTEARKIEQIDIRTLR